MIYGRKYLNEENLLKDEIILFSSEFTNEDVAYHDKKNGISIAVNATPNKKKGFILNHILKYIIVVNIVLQPKLQEYI